LLENIELPVLYSELRLKLSEVRLFSQDLIRDCGIAQEISYLIDVCYIILSYQSNNDALSLGKYAERLLALWRVEAVSHLRQTKDFKTSIEAELTKRHPTLTRRCEDEEHNLIDYTFYGIADRLINLF